MALTKFVTNVQDLSDDGGYKFRFCCDRCGNGVESQYVSSKSNLLKTGLQIFNLFRPGLGGYRTRDVVNGIDRGLRGKERDSAYEVAVQEAMVFFKQCQQCDKWVCTKSCWDQTAQACDGCMGKALPTQPPTSGLSRDEEAKIQKTVGVMKAAAQAFGIDTQKLTQQIPTQACSSCHTMNATGAKFCQKCGAGLGPKKCVQCGSEMNPTAKFCTQCGTKVA